MGLCQRLEMEVRQRTEVEVYVKIKGAEVKQESEPRWWKLLSGSWNQLHTNASNLSLS